MIENKELATFKKPGEVERFTKEEYEERIREIARCKRDIVYFCEHYFRITNLDKGLHLVRLYDVQKEFIKFLVDNNRVITRSGRQQGKCIFWLSFIKIRSYNHKWLRFYLPIGIIYYVMKFRNWLNSIFHNDKRK